MSCDSSTHTISFNSTTSPTCTRSSTSCSSSSSSYCSTEKPEKCQISLRNILSDIDYPSVITTVVFPGDCHESLVVATLPGKIYAVSDQGLKLLLDIEDRVYCSGWDASGYDERGLIGLAFHEKFIENGKMYLYYSQKQSDSCRLPVPVIPINPENPASYEQEWKNRCTYYDHITTLEEWKVSSRTKKHKCIYKSTLLSIRQPFFNHLGRNNLTWSKQWHGLLLLVGDGGYAYDPFNLAQKDCEVLGKLYMINADAIPKYDDSNVVILSKITDLPEDQKDYIKRIAKGICNGGSIICEKTKGRWITYVTLIGQDNIESTVAFEETDINFGWRAWEGYKPTVTIKTGTKQMNGNVDSIFLINTDAFETDGKGYNLTIKTGASISFFSNDNQPHTLVQADKYWKPLKIKRNCLVPPSNPFCATLKFNVSGTYYLISTINGDGKVVRICITVCDNTDSNCTSETECTTNVTDTTSETVSTECSTTSVGTSSVSSDSTCNSCSSTFNLTSKSLCEDEKITVGLPCYHNEIITFPNELKQISDYYRPFMCYNHRNFETSIGGSMIASATLYKGTELAGFKNHLIFADLSQPLIGGKYLGIGNLFSVKVDKDNLQKLQEPCLIDTSDRYENPGYFVSLGSNADRSRIFLGTFGKYGCSLRGWGKVYELVPTKCGYSTAGYYNPYDYIEYSQDETSKSSSFATLSTLSTDNCTVKVSHVDFDLKEGTKSCTDLSCGSIKF